MATWTGNATTGYLHTNGARLVKRGSRWVLILANRQVTLPKRATFDHAEREMVRS